jgi:hypothetical protein
MKDNVCGECGSNNPDLDNSYDGMCEDVFHPWNTKDRCPCGADNPSEYMLCSECRREALSEYYAEQYDDRDDHSTYSSGPDYWQNDAGEYRCG